MPVLTISVHRTTNINTVKWQKLINLLPIFVQAKKDFVM